MALITLVASHFVDSAAQRKHTDTFARTETATNDVLYTMRETLAYVDASQRYLLGATTRRDVQLARALLGRRLSVVGDNGVAAGDAAPVDYLSALTGLDEAVAQTPPGLLPADQRDRVSSFVLPRAETLSDAGRRLVDETAAQLHTNLRASDEALLRGRLTQLALIIVTLVFGAVLLIWVAANVARQYRSARTALDEEQLALRETQEQLDRVSALEREQARVLEQIATGAQAVTVMTQIAQLASKVTGGRCVRITAGARSVMYPADADTSGPPAWCARLDADTTVSTGAVEVFGEADGLDELALNALQRCGDLVSLALDRDASARQLSHQASHDALTGLANRSLLLARLSDNLVAARRSQTHLALLFCDLDRFKMVNDSIGHAGGDHLLIEAARRLSATVRETDVVARLGGDEFVVLCPELPDRAQAIALAERMRDALSAPYAIDGKEAFVGASIGITFADESTVSGAELMREADVAMYRAKVTEGSHINVFDVHLEAEVAQRLDLDAALRRALERDQLRLAAQPIVMLDTGVVTGFELLLQWRRPGLPDLSPVAFIPLAEDNGMIVEIGRWVLQEGISTLAQWRASGLALGLTISVNVSARQVREPGFADEVLNLLYSEGVPPEALIVELTEHALIDLRVAYPTVAQLRDAGVRVSLDDFGTGYSSLTQLRTLPVDEIKLDRSFAAALEDGSEKQRAVVRSVVSLANALALDLIVEGIETLSERDALVEIGARKGQGFLFDRPMDFASAYRLLESGAVCAVPTDEAGHRFGKDLSPQSSAATTGSGP
ncbi:EAL domain-containing protein [Mycolicibacterium sp.]|uniref:putative bifunctional diguanylate cyclase/phosphodiesterase n=1 Tax=Mycolicibacterium sp. TaxID=2320850 RepID=UPI001A23809B|nr:EAL domain-containing protein [Mycolicibacterium sp.]MBJ7339233.1 EAL domain-containing protein [Mycolicibacterium sp.]